MLECPVCHQLFFMDIVQCPTCTSLNNDKKHMLTLKRYMCKIQLKINSDLYKNILDTWISKITELTSLLK